MADFSSTGWIALFAHRQANVEGWDPVTRTALVVDPERGVMRPVSDYPDFSRLIPAHKVVGVLPGRGHRAHWRNFENGVPNTEEIIGWLVTQHGDALPFTSDGATAEDADVILAPGHDVPTEA
ncbi:hypothetical protein [Streptomyces sp. NBC_00306]|uniref:hypothetical protein n=1 Tax=Streptomyces sp. NBC_00306 TaxID=2975708 RepID=UPI002E2E4EEF|nr:hypothetical protein [Streptomyces sp. NBC_00306]